jgi:3-dehydroquinate dehydratase-1
MVPLETLSGYRQRGASLLEVRVDLFNEDFDRVLEYVGELRSRCGMPVIGTIRETDRTRPHRLELFERLVPLVDSIDIEVDAAIGREVAALCGDKPLIVSEHDFERTPRLEELHHSADRAGSLGASIAKVAVMARGRDDVTRVLRFCEESSIPTVAIAMGPLGTISRVIAPLFGSLFTYAFVGEREVAPGQLPLDELSSMIARLYPPTREA